MTSTINTGMLADVDRETAELILKLQLEDSQDFNVDRKDSRNTGEETDDQLAIRLAREEMQSYSKVLHDQKLAESVGEGAEPDPAGSLAIHEELQECSVCSESFYKCNIADVSCDCVYCVNCLRELFSRSFIDEGLFPPRCCRLPISPLSNLNLLTLDMLIEYDEKRVEYGTIDRVYCARPTCSVFIPPDVINGVETVSCPSCQARTCTICKALRHRGPCRLDSGLTQLDELAKQEGWQSCSRCRRMVELTHGCYHMSCPCGFQFCYLCQAEWKSCECAQWDDDMLLDQALEVVEAEALDVEQVEEVAHQLAGRHNCEHKNWAKRRGPNSVIFESVGFVDLID